MTVEAEKEALLKARNRRKAGRSKRSGKKPGTDFVRQSRAFIGGECT